MNRHGKHNHFYHNSISFFSFHFFKFNSCTFKPVPGSLILISSERLKNPWLIGSIFHANLDQVPGGSYFGVITETEEPLVDWLRFFITPFLINITSNIDRARSRSLFGQEPGLGAKTNNDNNTASEPKAPEPDGSNNDNEMPLEPTSRPRLRKEIFMSTTSQQQQPQHGRRGDRQHRRPPPPRSEQRPPTRRTTSTRSPDNSSEHQRPHGGDREQRDRAEAEKFRKTFDRCLISSKLHRRLQQMDQSARFCFLLVVFSKQTILLIGPQGTNKIFDTGSNPSSATDFFSLSIVNTNFSLDLV